MKLERRSPTITLISSELQKMAPDYRAGDEGGPRAAWAQEARRCREILRKLNSLGTQEAHVLNVLAIETLIEEVVEPLRDQRGGGDRNEGGAGPRSSLRRAIRAFYTASATWSKTRIDFARFESVDRTRAWTSI